LARWLRAGGSGEGEVYEVLVACGEACANAIAHAYAPGDAVFIVCATRDHGELEIAVEDTGTWRPTRRPARGRGLELMRQLMDSVEVDRHDGGTRIRLRRRLAGSPEAVPSAETPRFGPRDAHEPATGGAERPP
jgi:anti-sigma regulatory factor (Ser/Thr protein kinase)